MTDSANVQNWFYPFKSGSAEAVDPYQYYAALANAQGGYYPLGSNGGWHGGVHFDEATGLVMAGSEVRCIADGQVVAYRIDDTYPVTAYADTDAVASTGFVLIKHHLKVPASPTMAGAMPSPVPTDGAVLVFYSLYMHLSDMADYNAEPTRTRPPYWGGGDYRVRADVSDKVKGLNVREVPKGRILTTLPRGTIVTTGEKSADGNWLEVVSVFPEASELTSGSGWVYTRQMTHQGFNQYLIGDQASDIPATHAKGLNVLSTASVSASVISVLPAGTRIAISEDGAPSSYRKLIKILDGSPVPAMAADVSGNVPGYVRLSSLEALREPTAMGGVVCLETPFSIKAGDMIGHVGQYQNHSEDRPRHLIHLEVFSCEDVEAFITQSRSKASALPNSQKSLMKVYSNTKLITHRDDINHANPPKVSDAGTLTGYDLIIPVGVLEAMPAEKKIKQSAIAPDGTAATWWYLDGLLGDAQGNPISGWLAEQDLMTTRHSPWEWEGFGLIEETAGYADHFSAHLHDRDLLSEDEKATFVTRINTSTGSPMKQRLYSIIDTDKNGILTATEIRAALTRPWVAQPISQLVVKYESEWLYNAQKWDALDELLGHTAAQPNTNWDAEKKRIKQMSWWSEVAENLGLPMEGRVYHLHPVGIIANCKVIAGKGRKAKPWSISSEGIEFLKQYEAFSAVMYNDSAGHATIGYGHLIHHGPINGAASENPFLQGLTVAQAEALMKADLVEYEARVNNGIDVELAQHEYDALVIFAFNIGGPGFSSSSARAKLNQQAYGDVGEKMKMWNKVTLQDGTRVVSDGLVNRRAEEVEIFESADYVRTR